MSKKSWPISYSKLLYKMGQTLLDIQYVHIFEPPMYWNERNNFKLQYVQEVVTHFI